ncbi:MAG: glycoside hydrolase N-terminal domain-containing protein [Spirochaetales bacterium]|nr:glycoside hydrolase N-terminal domain-containing protein [Spirochaetales bacterium]
MKTKFFLKLITLFGLLSIFGCSTETQIDLGEEKENYLLSISAPIKSWDEAIPLGNGMTGALVWGGRGKLILSLDRGDLWDNRKVPEFSGPEYSVEMIKQSLADKNYNKIQEILDHPYSNHAYPTKLPGARLEVSLKDTRLAHFLLDKRDGSAQVITREGKPIKVITCQELPAYIVKLDNETNIAKVNLFIPGQKRAGKASQAYATFDQLNYETASTFSEGKDSWFVQKTLDKISYSVRYRVFETDSQRFLAVAITTSALGEDPSAEAKRVLDKIEASNISDFEQESITWWSKFNGNSSVSIPNKEIQQHYDLVKYYYGAASRTGAPPMPLQGVWTADTNGLPPWKGDFHFDLNVQMNYWACYQAGLEDSAQSLTDYLWNLRDKHKAFARDFYKLENGLVIPSVMTLDGTEMGGWPQYSFSITNTAWTAYHFYLEWVYNNDSKFLAEKAYPYCKDVGEGIAEFLEEDTNGNLILPFSSSPEIYDNSPKSWLTPNSNYDLACMQALFKALSEMATAQGKANEAEKWQSLHDRLGSPHIDTDGTLMFSSDVPYYESHRHLSNVMAIYPFELLDPKGSDRETIVKSLDLIKEKGSKYWTGYSFSWASCLEAYAGRPEEALNYLEIFVEAFISKNGFHVNGDQTGKGYSGFTYRPFTLEGNFAAMQAVHMMLLTTYGETIQIFPAISNSWKDVAFENLRTKGGHIISAEIINGELVKFSLTAGKAGVVKIDKNLFSGKKFNKDPNELETYLEWSVNKGETITLSF